MVPTDSGVGEIPDLHVLLQAAPVGIALVDARHRVVLANAAFGQIAGHSPEEHPGRALVEVLGPEAGRGVGQLVDAVAASGSPLLEKVVQAEDPLTGGHRDVLVRAYPVAEAAGEPVRHSGAGLVEVSSRAREERRGLE